MDRQSRDCRLWEAKEGVQPFPTEDKIRVNCGTCKFYQEQECSIKRELLQIKKPS